MSHRDWQAFLSAQGAVLEQATTQSFGDIERELLAAANESVVIDLSHYSLLRVKGEDSKDFLQGQLTSDVKEVSASLAQPSAWCNPKGRVITDLLVFERNGELFLQTLSELSQRTLQRLKLFVLRAKVSVADASNELVRIGVAGDALHTLLSEELRALPATPYETSTVDAVTMLRLPGRVPRTEIIGPMQAVRPVWELAKSHAVCAGAQAWKLLDIMAGLPTVYAATSEHFLPQMLNMDALSAVSFKKGCYVGQEIVARTQHLGRIKRRMYLARSTGESLPTPGADIVGALQDETSLGTIVDAQRHPDGGSVSLAVIKLDSIDKPLHLRGTDETALTISEPPYSL